MVIIDILGKIDEILLSQKIGLKLSNLDDEDKVFIKSEIVKEIDIRNVEYKQNILKYGESYVEKHTLKKLRALIREALPNYSLAELKTKVKCIDVIIENMVVLYLDVEEELSTCQDFETNYFLYRSCEKDYAVRILSFINFIHREFDEIHFINNIIDDRYDNRIIDSLRNRLDGRFKRTDKLEGIISILSKYGDAIDNYINNPYDYHRFNCLVSSITSDNEYGFYHYFKSYSLIELLLVKSNSDDNEIDKLLNKYIDDDLAKNNLSIILRQMRNKIGHGDFLGYNKKSELYYCLLMKDSELDYYEFNKQNWILISACCLLDDIIRRILVEQFKLSNNFKSNRLDIIS